MPAGRTRYKVAQSERPDIPNLLAREFDVQQPSQVWCGDITYAWASGRWHYFAAVLDLHTRRVVGWAMSDKRCRAGPQHKGVLDLSDLAFETRRRLSGPKAAWKYLVQAQINSGAWAGVMEREIDTCKRLDMVIKYFPNRCDEFVAATTYSMFNEPEWPRIAPSESIVYFYVQQKRIEDAVRFVEMMVNCVLEDTRTLPLARPLWAKKLDV